MEILVSTGALIGRPNDRDYRLLKQLRQELPCDGFEFMMYSDWYSEIDKIIDFLKKEQIHTPVYHCQKSIGEGISKGGEDMEEAYRRFEINAKMARDIGAKKIVIHLWDGITSDQHFANNLEAYGKLKQIADRYGVDALVENVVCNQEDPMKHWCELKERYPDIHFIFDTKMAAFHSQLELLYEEEYAWLWKEGHLRHFHVNDYAGGHMDWGNLRTLPMGRGQVDFDRFFAFVRKIGYADTFTIESTAFDYTGAIDKDMLKDQIESIRARMNQ